MCLADLFGGTSFNLHSGPKLNCFDRVLSKGKYITATEKACLKLPPKWQRNSGYKTRVLKWLLLLPKPSITKEESKDLMKLRQYMDRSILIADKGMAMVVLDRQGYINNCKGLLAQRETYRPSTMDPTNKQYIKLINILRTIKAEGGLEDITYKRLFNWHRPSDFYGLLKTHKRTLYLAHSVQWECSHLWDGQGATQHYQTIGRTSPITSRISKTL